jgi:hypothetical protein
MSTFNDRADIPQLHSPQRPRTAREEDAISAARGMIFAIAFSLLFWSTVAWICFGGWR